MRKFLAFCTALIIAGIAIGQQTPQQLENNAASFKSIDPRSLQIIDAYLLSVIVGMGSTSPATLLANAAGFKAISDRDLANIQTYLLSQFAGSVVANAQSTNYGVATTNGLNILISPDSTAATFTNALRAIAIGATFPVGSVSGNGIYIGGGGPGAGGGTGTNGIAIGQGTAASAFWDTGLTTPSTSGNTAIGNQADNFGPLSILIACSGGNNYLGGGNYACAFIGNENNDGGVTVSNAFFFGNNANLVSLKSHTHYFGSPGNNPLGGTTGIVFFASGAGTTPSVTIARTNLATSGFLTSYGQNITGSGATNAGQFNYVNLQYATNCGWGLVASNGTAGTTVVLKGYEEFVVTAGATAVQLGDATTNAGHHVSITCGSAGTNGIFPVASQKIAGKAGTASAGAWTNTAIFTCTQLISDGANWQICGTRGN